MFTLHDIIGIAVQVEENGERTYREAAAKVRHPQLAALLIQLADDEARHAEWFKNLGGRIDRVEVDDRLNSLGSSMLRGIVGDENFSLADVDWAKAGGVADILASATELEADTVIFYEMIRSFVNDAATLTHLDTIIEEERSHGRQLQQALEASESSTAGDSE